MGSTKTYLFDRNTTTLSLALRALAHPARLTVIRYLLERKYATNKELVEHLGLCQSTTSSHIKEMININLVFASEHENRVYYSLHADLLNQIVSALGLFTSNAAA